MKIDRYREERERMREREHKMKSNIDRKIRTVIGEWCDNEGVVG